jgi:hypothetical protein
VIVLSTPDGVFHRQVSDRLILVPPHSTSSREARDGGGVGLDSVWDATHPSRLTASPLRLQGGLKLFRPVTGLGRRQAAFLLS